MPSTEGTSEPQRRILHADADAFYVAVVRLVDPMGVAASNFHESRIEDEQLWLLGPPSDKTLDSADENPLLEAVDDINTKFGTQSIVRASTVAPAAKRRGLS